MLKVLDWSRIVPFVCGMICEGDMAAPGLRCSDFLTFEGSRNLFAFDNLLSEEFKRRGFRRFFFFFTVYVCEMMGFDSSVFWLRGVFEALSADVSTNHRRPIIHRPDD